MRPWKFEWPSGAGDAGGKNTTNNWTLGVRSENKNSQEREIQRVQIQGSQQRERMSHALGRTAYAGRVSGNSRMIVAPRPSVLLIACIVARCASTIPRQIERPRPDP